MRNALAIAALVTLAASFILPVELFERIERIEVAIGWDLCVASFRLMQLLIEGEGLQEGATWRLYILAFAWMSNPAFLFGTLGSMWSEKDVPGIYQTFTVAAFVLGVAAVFLFLEGVEAHNSAPIAWCIALLLGIFASFASGGRTSPTD